jgi:predicted transcriptional regulator
MRVICIRRYFMPKTVIYSWRLDPDLRRRLDEVARAERMSVARLLDRIAREWLAKREVENEAEQGRLHAEAAKWIGSISSGDRYGSERVKERVRAKLFAKHRRLQREAPGSRRH